MKQHYGALLVAIIVPIVAFDDLGCTVWNDAVVPNGGGGAGGSQTTSGSTMGTGGGGGGETPATLLSIEDAAKICGWAAQDLQFTTSLVASLALPIGRSDGLWEVANQSECFTWLAGPIPSDRTTTAAKQRSVLQSLVKAASSSEATALLPIQFQKHDGKNCLKSQCDGSNNAVTCGQPGGADVTSLCSGEFFQNEGCLLYGAEKKPVCAFGFCNTDKGPPKGCNGDSQSTYCSPTLKQSIDCGYQGLVCIDNSCNNAGEMTLPVCDGASIGQIDCSGTELRVCDGGLWVAFHCENVVAGSTCTSDATLGSRCKFDNDDGCSSSDTTLNMCSDESHLVVCLAGKKTMITCPNGCFGSYCAPP